MESKIVAMQDCINRRLAQIANDMTTLKREQALLTEGRFELSLGMAPAVVLAKLTAKGIKVGGLEDAMAEALL